MQRLLDRFLRRQRPTSPTVVQMEGTTPNKALNLTKGALLRTAPFAG